MFMEERGAQNWRPYRRIASRVVDAPCVDLSNSHFFALVDDDR